MNQPWRAIVVDDYPILLAIAARLLAGFPRVEVVGTATSGQEALDAVARLRPDLVLMDLNLPGMGGLEATRRITARPDAPAVIIMTVHDLPQYRNAALAQGARSFIAKSDLATELSRALQVLFTHSDADQAATHS